MSVNSVGSLVSGPADLKNVRLDGANHSLLKITLSGAFPCATANCELPVRM